MALGCLLAGCYTGLPTAGANSDSAPTTSASTTSDPSDDDDDDDGDGSSSGDVEEPDELVPLPSLHRLNRIEYDNTMRDLLGTELTPARTFPPDLASAGFDNNAEALTLPPALLEAYYAASREVLTDAFTPRHLFAVDLDEDAWTFDPEHTANDLILIIAEINAENVVLPVGGTTEIELALGHVLEGTAPAPVLEVLIDDVSLETIAVGGSGNDTDPHLLTAELTAGEHVIVLRHTNPMQDAVAGDSNTIVFGGMQLRSTQTVPGPADTLVMICDPVTGGSSCTRSILERFVARAWRSPPSTQDIDQLMTLHDGFVLDGEPTQAAIELTLRAVLASPRFFFRTRTLDDADHEAWLDPYVLASRLSYFLWSSMPDDALFEAAATGELTTLEGLRHQTERMLDDPKADAMIDSFAEQWLYTRLLLGSAPSPQAYPTYTDAVEAAMVEESKALFRDFLRSDAPAADMLAPGFTYRNGALTQHYAGIVPTDDLMPDEDPLVRTEGVDRSGILALGGWLTVNSEAEHSSPIRRGAWVSDNILCTPVQPPSSGLEIPELPPPSDDATVREQLEEHRSNPTCSVCHASLDIVGMGFEIYDGTGRLRTEPDLDSLGELPTGETFVGADGLANVLDDARFLQCLTEKLFVYASGRASDPNGDDDETIEAIALEAAEQGSTLRELITALVMHPDFYNPTPLQ